MSTSELHQQQQLPDKLRLMKARINHENAKLVQKLDRVKSSIPLTTPSERKEQTVLMSNYRRFASKYAGEKPKLDPLILKKVKRDAKRGDRSTQMVISQVSRNRAQK